jgi:hypothetical protein
MILNHDNNYRMILNYNHRRIVIIEIIIIIHPFIEYIFNLNPLKSCFILFLFLFIGKTTKQKVVLFILILLYYLNNMNSLTLTLITNHNSETLSYTNIKTVLTQQQDTQYMVQFILFLLHLQTINSYKQISLKKWIYCLLLKESATLFKCTFFLIRLKKAPIALYGPHLLCEPPSLVTNMP